jgi:hypothetical protein
MLQKSNCRECLTVYLGNVKVVWTNGSNVDVTPRGEAPVANKVVNEPVVEDDLPF